MTNETQNLDNRESGQITIGACYRLPDFEFYHADSLLKMKELKSESVDCILTDPPYKYLKNQKLEIDFDETIFFNEVKRVLKKDGFIVLFGRGTSFYRWNYMLSELGFNFKEEIVWDKSYSTSPLMAISRVHETISIHSKGKGTINKVRIPYLEMKSHNLDSIVQDVNRIKGALNNTKSLENLINFLKNNANNDTIITNRNDWTGKISKNEVTASNGSAKSGDRSVSCLQTIKFGLNEKTIIRIDYGRRSNKNMVTYSDKIKDGDKSVNCINSIVHGQVEKSIIKQIREHYTSIHPTQKPVRLLERLLALTTKEGDLVIDPFSGSCSTGEACLNMKRKFIGYEIDNEYFTKATERIKRVEPLLFSGCL